MSNDGAQFGMKATCMARHQPCSAQAISRGASNKQLLSVQSS